MYFPIPRIILIPYRLISLLIDVVFGKREYSERDRQILKWRSKPDDPMRPQDYTRRHVRQLSAAIEAEKSVYLRYAKRNESTSRRVIPKRLFRRGDDIYLEAFCLNRRQYRAFRVDRIKYLRGS